MNDTYAKHGLALLIKSTFTIIALVALSYVNQYAFGFALFLSLLIIPISYFVGDLYILPLLRNTVATIVDIVLTLGVIWLIGPFILGADIPFIHALWTSLVIGVGEWFYHQYVSISIFGKNISPLKQR